MNGYNSVLSEWIDTKFDANTENEDAEMVSMEKVISHKIQDGGKCHTVNHVAIADPILAIFAPNVIHVLKKGSRSQLYFKMHLVQKCKKAVAIFKSVRRR